MVNKNLSVAAAVRIRILASFLVLLLGLTSCQQPSAEDLSTFISNDATQFVGKTPPPLPVVDNSLRFDHVTLEQGLSQSTVNTIIQDDQGFMWFGTNNGLNRYDGYGITVFKHEPSNANSLSDNHIQALLSDSTGAMWIATQGGGLEKYDRDQDQFIHHVEDPDDPKSISSNFVYSVHEDRTGDLWVGALNGLNKYNAGSGDFTTYRNDLNPDDEPVGSNLILAIHDDPDGILWLGTASGLITFDPATEEFSGDPLPSRFTGSPVSWFHEDTSGDLWIGTLTDGAYRYNPESGEVTLFRQSPVQLDSLSSNTVRAIDEDSSGNIWIATDEGLNRFAPGGTGFIHEQHDPNRESSLSENLSPSLFVDESGIVWSGTFTGGINKFDPYKAKFGHVKSDPEDRENTLSNNMVLSFLVDSQKQLWVGTMAGLNRIDPDTGEVEQYMGNPGDPYALPDGVIGALLEDQFGDIWIGSYGGLSHFNPESGHFDSYRYNPNDPDGLAYPIVLDLFEDSRGDFWVATGGRGFEKFDRDSGTFTHYQFDEVERIDNVGPDNIQTFFEDSSGGFWIGTMAGLAKFDRDTEEITYYPHDPADPTSLSDNYVLTIHEDSAGRLWIGTQNGLNRFVPGDETFVRYLGKEGLPDNVVYGILEDDEGYLWISTNKGIAKFNPADETFHHFDTGDGLQALEFNVGAHQESVDGELFFGGINGFNHFYPSEISDNPYLPPVVVTNFQIMNQEVEPGQNSRITKPVTQLDKIELDRDDTSISFELASLHYSAPEENQYAYIMEGFDEEWNFIGNRRHATYTNLPPGEYTFRAVGTNSDGVWNTEGTAIEVTMPYPFWRTWWFLLLAIILFVASIYGAIRLRTRSAEARTRELEAEVTSRTSEVERRREIAEGLREILVILNSNRSLEESLHYIVDQAARLTDAEDAIIFRQEISVEGSLLDPVEANDPVSIIATNEGGQIRYAPGPALLAITTEWIDGGLQSKKPLVIPNLADYWSDHPAIQPTALAVHQALLGVPLHLGDEIYGGLLMFYTSERSFSPDDLELGSTFADQAALAIANDRLRSQAEETAVATERNRLARDLHDAVTQTLFSASLIAETLPLIYENNESQGRNLLQELRQLTRGALAEMRTLLLELRPIALEESELPDLLLQLSEAVTGRTGVPIDTTIEKPCKLPIKVRIALYRIAQESLNNVMKHARASKVNVNLGGCKEGEIVTLSISDNGRGYDTQQVSSDRMGLKIIKERAQAIGAELSIRSTPGEGTMVEVLWQPSSQE